MMVVCVPWKVVRKSLANLQSLSIGFFGLGLLVVAIEEIPQLVVAQGEVSGVVRFRREFVHQLLLNDDGLLETVDRLLSLTQHLIDAPHAFVGSARLPAHLRLIAYFEKPS